MEITTDTYGVHLDESKQIIIFNGSLRLSGMEEYKPIISILDTVCDQKITPITLDLTDLQFLNSSGINVLSKFVIRLRKEKSVDLIVKGSKKIPWQGKSLKNLQRLMPSLQLEWI